MADTHVSMIHALRAELLKLSRWPATWVLAGIALLAILFFEYFLGYTTYLQEQSGIALPDAEPPQMLLASLLPGQAVLSVVDAGYIDVVALVLGALVAGSGYGWGTIKTDLAAGPSRSTIYFSQVCALALILALLVIVLFASALGASLLIERLQGADFVWEPLWQFPAGMVSEFLVLAMEATVGLALATVSRSSAIGIGLGIGLFYVVEGTIETFSFVSPVLQGIVNWLPGANAGSLTSVFGSLGGGPNSDTRGPANGDTSHFVLVLVLYTIVSLAVGARAFISRDVT